jgi:NNP family nitrate/nitrite transporter-like MFS transporter
MLTFGLIVGTDRLCIVVLFKEISVDLNLNLVQLGTIFGMDPLAGVFVGLIAGLLVDRFGAKNTLTVVCLLAGVFGALRGLSIDFFSMAATMFIFGLMVAMIPNIVPKVTAVWFSGRYLGVTNAIIQVAFSLGSMVGTMFSATVFSPLLGGWRNVLFMYGAPAVLISLLWFTTGREPNKNELQVNTASGVPFRQALSQVMRIKEVWIIGLIFMSQSGAMLGMFAYLPLYLREIGWPPASADSALTIVIGLSCITAVPIVLLSDRLGSRKWVFIAATIIASVTMGSLALAQGTGVWILLILSGLVRSIPLALFNTIIVEVKGVGSTYAGTAIGLANTISWLGAFFLPALGNSFAAINPGLPFAFWGFLCVISLAGFLFLREQRVNKRQ